MSEAPSQSLPDPPFLDPDPPPWAARGLAYTLLLLFTVSMIAAVAVKVPETVNGTFVLVPQRGADPVRAVRKGVVTEVRASEGEAVARGAVLFVLQSEPQSDRGAELRTLRAQLAGAAASKTNAEAENAGRARADADEARRLRNRLDYLERTIALKTKTLDERRALLERYRQGVQRKVVSEEEYSRMQLEVDGYSIAIEDARNERDQTRLSLSKLENESAVRVTQFRETLRRMETDMESWRIRAAALERELPGAGADSAVASAGALAAGVGQLVVAAPCAGTVLRLQVSAAGAVVQEGEVLGEVSCGDDKLQAEVSVPQSGVPKLSTNMTVKLLYDAFPYQRYGIRYGTLRWVGPATASATSLGAPGVSAAAALGAGPQFRALVDIKDDTITVNGTPRALQPGMGGRADILTGHRTLISYAFEPIRQLREAMRGGPGT